MNSILYTPYKIDGLEIKNRFTASAVFDYGADNGKITGKIKKRYASLADGGTGMIISGMHAVRPEGGMGPFNATPKAEGYAEGLKEITEYAHKQAAKFFVQLCHCGTSTSSAEGYDTLAVCETKGRDGRTFHAATEEELKRIEEDFADSARICQQGGADGIEIHAAHGYLVNTFLSPVTNHRTDAYGGNAANRARFLFEVYDAIRSAVGPEFIVGIKFPFNDLMENSIRPEDSLWTCRELEKRGIDFIEVTSGIAMSRESSSTPRVTLEAQAPFAEYAREVADAVSVPVISVCGYRTPEAAEKVLTETKISAVSLARPLIREPDLPNRWKTDRSPAKCISCSHCFRSAADGIVTCQVEKALNQ